MRIKRSALPETEADFSAPIRFSSAESATPLDILDVDAALDALAEKAPRAAIFLELRYFAGLQDIEISELYGVSRPTVERECRFAKAFFISYAKHKQARCNCLAHIGSDELKEGIRK
jgi:DNA-directed RNA polymerase specialized sigma24 family protein